METLVYDTAAIFNFGHRDDLTFLLEKLSKAHTLLTTPDVVAEIADPARAAYYRKLLADWFEVKPVSSIPFDTATLAALSATLDPGEISVLTPLACRAAFAASTLAGVMPNHFSASIALTSSR